MKKKSFLGLTNLFENEGFSLESVLSLTKKQDQIITFKIEDKYFGLDVIKVKELMGYNLENPPKKVMNVPKYISGVINLRGEIIPVMDIRVKMDFPEKVFMKFNVIIVIESEKFKLGIIVDEVLDIIPFEKENLQKSIASISTMNVSFVNFLYEYKGKIIYIINTDLLLDIQEQEGIEDIIK